MMKFALTGKLHYNKENYQINLPNIKKPSLKEKTTYYNLAKDAEFNLRNLKMAEFYYNLAIENNERVDSAVKDLATVIHQRGRTEEACKLLEKFRQFYKGDSQKYENLIKNLRKQIKPTGNCSMKKLLLVLDKNNASNNLKVCDFFNNYSRIMSIEVFTDNCFLFDKEMKIDYDGFLKNMKNQESNTKIFVLLSFNSYSQAKKTLDSIKKSNLLIFWMNFSGRIVAQAWKNQQHIEQNKIRMTEPIWEQVLFMPLDSDKRATSQYDFLPKIKEIWYENPNLPMLISPLTILQKAYENKLFIDINLSPDKFFIFPA